MTTEEELIHTIHDVIRAGESNSDDPINERLMRSFLRIHRGKHLSRTFEGGMQITDEAFQDLGDISFSLINGVYVSSPLPKIIRFKNNFGIIASKDNYIVSLVGSEEFLNSQKDRFNKFHPKLHFLGDKLTLYLGQESCTDNPEFTNSELNRTVKKLVEEAKFNSLKINFKAVLVNPDDGIGYDFTTSPYPYPDEIIEDLINSVNIKEFNIFLKMKSDETGDSRNNTSEFNTREEL